MNTGKDYENWNSIGRGCFIKYALNFGIHNRPKKSLNTMSRAAFSAFARNASRFQNIRTAAMKGMTPLYMKAKPMGTPMNFACPEMLLKNQRVTQLTKLAYRSRRLCALQLQKMQLGALSVLLTSAGEILIDFQDLINSLEEDEEEELLRRTSLLVQSQRSG